VRAVFAGFRELPETPRRRYILIVLAASPEQRFDLVKGAMMMEEEREPLWQDPLREIEERGGLFAYYRRKALEASEKGREQGRKEGLEKGKATLVEMILAMLEVRGLAVDADTATRVRSCGDLREIERWARRAREVEFAVELFST
jgi:hypothetical protein